MSRPDNWQPTANLMSLLSAKGSHCLSASNQLSRPVSTSSQTETNLARLIFCCRIRICSIASVWIGGVTVNHL